MVAGAPYLLDQAHVQVVVVCYYAHSLRLSLHLQRRSRRQQVLAGVRLLPQKVATTAWVWVNEDLARARKIFLPKKMRTNSLNLPESV